MVKLAGGYLRSSIAIEVNRLASTAVLPDDVLLLVFEECLQNNRTTPSNQLKRMKALVCLSHVSAEWRSMMLSARKLWASIELCSPSTDMVNAFLDRSLGCMLEVYWSIWDVNALEDDTLPREYVRNLDQASKHLNRWHRIHVNCEWVDHADFFLYHVRGLGAASLQHVEIYAKDTCDVDSTDLDVHTIPTTPALTSLELTGLLPVSFPNLSSLLTLTLRHSDHFDHILLLTLLVAATSLENLTVYGEPLSKNDLGHPVTMPYLRNLRIFIGDEETFDDGDVRMPDVSEASSLARSSNFIVAPELRNLVIHGVTPSKMSYFCNSLPIGSPRYPKLEYLELSTHMLAEDAARHLIRALPTVTHANFCGHSGEPYLNVLREDVDPQSNGESHSSKNHTLLWPQLRIITANSFHCTELGDTVYALVEGRAKCGFPLAELRVFNDLGKRPVYDISEDDGWAVLKQHTAIKVVERMAVELQYVRRVVFKPE